MNIVNTEKSVCRHLSHLFIGSSYWLPVGGLAGGGGPFFLDRRRRVPPGEQSHPGGCFGPPLWGLADFHQMETHGHQRKTGQEVAGAKDYEGPRSRAGSLKGT